MIRFYFQRSILGSIFLLLWGCNTSPDTLSVEAYQEYVDKVFPDWIKKVQVNEFVFEAMYESVDYKLSRIVDDTWSQHRLDSTRSGWSDMQYYVLKIHIDGSEKSILDYQLVSEQEYQDRLTYFSFSFQEDIYLEEAGRVLPCLMYHFERSYDLQPHRNFVLAFEQNEMDKFANKVLVIHSGFFHSDPIRIQFSGKKISDLPTLSIK